MKLNEALIQRFGVIKKALILINQSSPRKNHRETLLRLNELLKTYPDFLDDVRIRKIDVLVSFSITKIQFGLLGYIPPKSAIQRACEYLTKSYNLIDKNKG